MSHTLTSHEFLFTNGGNEVHTHTGPSVLASVCTSRLNRSVSDEEGPGEVWSMEVGY